jgi:hypothetical protein
MDDDDVLRVEAAITSPVTSPHPIKVASDSVSSLRLFSGTPSVTLIA